MSKENEIKIVPPKPVQKTEEPKEIKQPPYFLTLSVLSLGYIALVILLAFLPMSGTMRVLSLILGAFLIFDLHHSVKYYVGRE